MSETFAVRIHGRGGQGVVTAAELLSVAAFLDGRYAQAFPSFGSERMGAPVMSFCRISTAPIRVREPVLRPDAVLVVDATLLHHVDLFSGLAPDGYVLVNSARSPRSLAITDLGFSVPPAHVRTVDATEIAREHTGRPLPNVALLGAFAALTGRVTRQSLETAVTERFLHRVASANVEALRAAYAVVREPTNA
jgi:pyruvate ferredoxin oxidoreductase gamma subunit